MSALPRKADFFSPASGRRTPVRYSPFAAKPIRSVRTAFDKACKKAGLENVRFHDLRLTFASRLVQGGVPIYDVMHLTGHTSLEMVQRYAHLAPNYQERAIQALNALGHILGTIEGQNAA